MQAALQHLRKESSTLLVDPPTYCSDAVGRLLALLGVVLTHRNEAAAVCVQHVVCKALLTVCYCEGVRLARLARADVLHMHPL